MPESTDTLGSSHPAGRHRTALPHPPHPMQNNTGFQPPGLSLAKAAFPCQVRAATCDREWDRNFRPAPLCGVGPLVRILPIGICFRGVLKSSLPQWLILGYIPFLSWLQLEMTSSSAHRIAQGHPGNHTARDMLMGDETVMPYLPMAWGQNVHPIISGSE